MIELQQDVCSSCEQVTGVRFFPHEDVWHCEDCQAYDLDTIKIVTWTNHEGAYDCTPFCPTCNGNQEYIRGCLCGQIDPLPLAHDDGCPVWEKARQEQQESEEN
jgi:hypothetical protein